MSDLALYATFVPDETDTSLQKPHNGHYGRELDRATIELMFEGASYRTHVQILASTTEHLFDRTHVLFSIEHLFDRTHVPHGRGIEHMFENGHSNICSTMTDRCHTVLCARNVRFVHIFHTTIRTYRDKCRIFFWGKSDISDHDMIEMSVLHLVSGFVPI